MKGTETYIQFSEQQLEQIRLPEEETDKVLLTSQLVQNTMRFSKDLFTFIWGLPPNFIQFFLFICFPFIAPNLQLLSAQDLMCFLLAAEWFEGRMLTSVNCSFPSRL